MRASFGFAAPTSTEPASPTKQGITAAFSGNLGSQRLFDELHKLRVAKVYRAFPNGAGNGEREEGVSIGGQRLRLDQTIVPGHQPAGVEMDDDQIQKFLLHH